MAKVSLSTRIWTDPDMAAWNPLSRFFYIHLFTSPHAHGLTGTGSASVAVMCAETGMTEEQINAAILEIGDKVMWSGPGVYWVCGRARNVAYDADVAIAKHVGPIRREMATVPDDIREAFAERYPEFGTGGSIATVKVTHEMSLAIRDEFKCAYCGQPLTPDTFIGDKLDADGNETYTNMVAAHRACAENKTDKMLKRAAGHARAYYAATAKRIVRTDSAVAAEVERYLGKISPPAKVPLDAVKKHDTDEVSDTVLQGLDDLAVKILGGSQPIQLLEAVKEHGAEHVEAALKKSKGKKSFKYTLAILNRWKAEGYPKHETGVRKRTILDVN